MLQLTPILAQLMPIVTHSGLWTTVLAASATLLARSVKNPYVRGRDWPLVSVKCQNKVHQGIMREMSKEPVINPQDPFALKAKHIFEKAVMDVKMKKSKRLSRMPWDLVVQTQTALNCSISRVGVIVIDKTDTCQALAEDDDRVDHRLAFTMCHEIGHSISFHEIGLERIPSHIPFFGTFLFKRYLCMKRERKADEIAVLLAANIGYDPRAMLDDAIDYCKYVPEQMEHFESVIEFRNLLNTCTPLGRAIRYIPYKALSMFLAPITWIAGTEPPNISKATAIMRSGAMERAVKLYESKESDNKPYIFKHKIWPEFEVPVTGELVSSESRPNNSMFQRFQDFLCENL